MGPFSLEIKIDKLEKGTSTFLQTLVLLFISAFSTHLLISGRRNSFQKYWKTIWNDEMAMPHAKIWRFLFV